MEEYLLIITALIAEIIGTMAGFGSSTIFLPLALFFLDFNTALAVVAILHIFGNVGRVFFFKKGLDIKLAISFGIPGVLFALVGASIIRSIPSDLLKAILGLFLVAYAIQSMKFNEIKFKPVLTTAVIGGGLSGFMAGLVGTGGAIRGAFLSSFNLDKSTYIATAASVAILVDLTRLPVYIANGFLSEKYYFYIPFLIFAAFTGSFIGKTIVSRIPQETFRKVVLVAIALVGVKFVIDFIF
ncbi:MAG TPA: sulfite exporter TauE/SafE family protein [Candidatus Bilamarchaeaceae archaeon]|nr:sulfite exporter TauE/SafE family protein [Candidatus Bilamarchaeaceae archaeon]